MSPESCCAQASAAARRVLEAFTAMALHCAPPFAASQAFSQFWTLSMIVWAIRLLSTGTAETEAIVKARETKTLDNCIVVKIKKD